MGLILCEIYLRRTKKKPQRTAPERFELFVQRVDELLDKRIVRQDMRAEFTMRWDVASQRLTQQLTQPDEEAYEEALQSFLLLFRQFISENEPIFINRIFTDTIRYLQSDTLKTEVEKARKAWNDSFRKMGSLQVVIDNKELTAEYLLDLWINGHYFHNDSEKEEELRRYLATGDMPLVRMQLLTVLPGLTQIVGYMGKVIKSALQEGHFSFPENDD